VHEKLDKLASLEDKRNRRKIFPLRVWPRRPLPRLHPLFPCHPSSVAEAAASSAAAAAAVEKALAAATAAPTAAMDQTLTILTVGRTRAPPTYRSRNESLGGGGEAEEANAQLPFPF